MLDLTDANILVVDDNPDNLKLLVGMLKQTQYHVRAAIDGKTALMSLEKQLPDLIMLDINMPEMNGYEVAQQLKGNPETQDIPIIFISALDDTESIVNAFEHGGVDYVTKPFQFAEVNARIRTHLTLHFQRQQLLYFREKDQKQLEQIRRSEEQYRDLFDNASDIIQSVDEEGYFVYANRAWHDLLGYTPIEMKKMTFADIIHEDHIDRCVQIFDSIRKHPNINQRIETIFITKSGEEVVVQGNINCRHDPEYGFHTRGIFRDITGQRQAEKQAIQLTLERERHQILSDFIRDSSHELRTPLSVISQQLYFIRRLANEEKQLAKVQVAETKVKELNHIIGQLHDFVKLNSQQAIDISKIDVRQWVHACVMASEEQAQQAQVDLKVNIAEGVTAIQGNFDYLQQALNELLINAIRYSNTDSEVVISVRQPDDDFVQIRVIDHGTGIAPEFHEKIFTPMFKVNEARTPDGSGIGLGLSMVKRIVELHDGDIVILNHNDERSGIQIMMNLPS